MKRKLTELINKLETNGYCCIDCGSQYLSPEQKKDDLVTTFHKGVCVLCDKYKSVTHVRNYNWLIKSTE